VSDARAPKVQAFLDEIIAVCEKHGLVIAQSGHESLQVWPLTEPERQLAELVDAGDRTD
jgi:hypothetical protein